MSIGFNKFSATLLVSGAFLSAAGIAGAQTTLWYNGDADGADFYYNEVNGANYGQLIATQFVATGTWNVEQAWTNNIFTAGVPASTTASWAIFSDMSVPTVVASGDSQASLISLGQQDGWDYDTVLVKNLNVTLGPGTYWLEVYADNENGGIGGDEAVATTSNANSIGVATQNFYFNQFGSSYFGPDAQGISAGLATPEPAPFAVLGLGALALLRRRNRSK